MTIEELLKTRLANQKLLPPLFKTPAEVVSYLGAVQAQEYTPSKWAVGQRMVQSNDEMLESAFTNGEILRTHIMRPTWHFVHPKDIRWMLQLTAPRVDALCKYYHKKLELTDAVLTRSNKVITAALMGKRALDRNELSQLLQESKIPTDGIRLGFLLMHAEQRGVLVSGPRRGKQFTYMLLEERAPMRTGRFDRDESLAELTLRYFRSHGPALAKDFSWWSGLPMIDVKRGLDFNRRNLESVIIDAKTYWLHKDSPKVSGELEECYLLSVYDEYLISYADRSMYADSEYFKQLNPRDNITFTNTIVYKGKIVGSWKRSFKKDTITINPTFFQKPDIEFGDAFTKAAKKYATFLGMKLVLV